MNDLEQKYQRVSALLRELLRATYNNRKGYCLLCGSGDHVGHMECPAEIIKKEYEDLKKE